MARVLLEHVEKVYPNGFTAIHDFDLEAADGELLVLVGPSGCGKTTTLRMIAGLETATRGRITIGPRVVDQVAPKDRDVAMVFQNNALYPHMTAFGNMGLALRLRGVRRAEIDRKVRQAAAMLGIEHLLGRRPGQLSGGQSQRVALGRAIVRDPACFLFDEPLSDLDARLRAEMRAELKRLHAKLGTTTIHVTHDQEEAMYLADRMVVIREGRIQQIGSPQEVFRRPANQFAAGFLGNAPMNFLEGRIVQEEDRLWFHDGSQRLAVPDRAAGELSGWIGAPVVLGVRPEHFSVTPLPGQVDNTLRATIHSVQPLGDRTYAQLSTDRHRDLLAQVEAGESVSPGGHQPIHVDLDCVHFFDPDDETTGRSGANLCGSGAGGPGSTPQGPASAVGE